MSRPNFGSWIGRDFPPSDTAPNAGESDAPGCLFDLRRYQLELTSLARETLWSAGYQAPRTRLAGLGRLAGEGLKIIGPAAGQTTQLDTLWVSLAPAGERGVRGEAFGLGGVGGYSMLEIACPRLRGDAGLSAELKLYLEPVKLAELQTHLDLAHGELRVSFMLEIDEDIALAVGAPRLALPVYEVSFQLLQTALPARENPTRTPALLPQLEHALQRELPAALCAGTQLERVGRELAASLGAPFINRARPADQAARAKTELERWLRDVRAGFRYTSVSPDLEERLLALDPENFELEIAKLDTPTQTRLRAAYGTLSLLEHPSAAPRGKKPHHLLYAERHALEHLAQRYCDHPELASPTLEWCLITTLLRSGVNRAARQTPPRAVGLAREVLIQGALAGAAALAAPDALTFWLALLTFNLLRFNLPRTRRPSPHETRAALQDDLTLALESLAAKDFNSEALRKRLAELQTRGARLSPMLDRLLAKRIARERARPAAPALRLAA